MYSLIADIESHLTRTELLRLVNDENRSAGAIVLTDETDVCTIRIAEQISAADAEIDSYLRSGYTVPLETIPSRIKEISIDIAIYNLYKRRFRLDMPETLSAIYKERIKELEKIQKGTIVLGITVPVTELTSPETVVNKTAEERLFNKSTMDLY